MDSSKYLLIVLFSAIAISTASCVVAEEAPRTVVAEEVPRTHEDYVREAAQSVDAKTSASWRELSPEEIITADELRKLQLNNPKLVIFDARDEKTYAAMHIQGAILPLPLNFYRALRDFRQGAITSQPDHGAEMANAMKDYPKDTPFVAYCNEGCKASSGLLLRLKNLGFTDVRAMEEGVQAWQLKGYPVTIGISRLSLEPEEDAPAR